MTEIRQALPKGQTSLRIEQTEFSLSNYEAWLAENAESIDAFTAKREQAFEEELQRWRDNGQFTFTAADAANSDLEMSEIPEGTQPVDSTISGNVWKIEVEEGETVCEGQTILILESMKMEIEIQAQEAGVISKVLVGTGQEVQAGQCLIWLEQ